MVKKGKDTREVYIDNLRLFVIIQVVIIHFAVTYSGIGGWYYIENTNPDTLTFVILGIYESFTQAYFMGFLFLISGYFVPKSYDKKGPAKFVKDRLIRLGIPTLIYMFVISPFIGFAIMNYAGDRANPLKAYIHHITSFEFLGSSGPLWFAFALLIFDLVYVLVRLVTKDPNEEKKPLPRLKPTIILILIISVAAFLIRIVQPIGTNVMNMQLCFFAQYIILFILGIKASRYDWFNQIKYEQGRKWLFTALIPGLVAWIIFMIAGGVFSSGFAPFEGHLTWQSFVYAVWESFTAVAMSIGLIALFKERHNKQNKLMKTLSDNSFCVYMFHSVIILAMSKAVAGISVHPLIKFVVLCNVGVPVCFLISHFILRRIPLLKKVL